MRANVTKPFAFSGAITVDCYYHNAVPSVAVCTDCRQTICATCRDAQGTCPGCRLKARIDAASATAGGRLGGDVGPSNPPPGPPPPRGPSGPFYEGAPSYGSSAARVRPQGALCAVSPETRALLALGYPLWPLAALALLDPKRSPAVRRQATQALAVNFGLFGMWIALEGIWHIPVLGLSAWPLLAAIFPVWFVATIVYAVRAWHGDDVRVPLISDWLDEREANTARAA
jgi:hypothetical protein